MKETTDRQVEKKTIFGSHRQHCWQCQMRDTAADGVAWSVCVMVTSESVTPAMSAPQVRRLWACTRVEPFLDGSPDCQRKPRGRQPIIRNRGVMPRRCGLSLPLLQQLVPVRISFLRVRLLVTAGHQMQRVTRVFWCRLSGWKPDMKSTSLPSPRRCWTRPVLSWA